MATIPVFVKTLSGAIITVECARDELVWNIKLRLFAQTRTPPEGQRLIGRKKTTGGRVQLDDAWRLGVEIDTSERFDLVWRLKGGTGRVEESPTEAQLAEAIDTIVWVTGDLAAMEAAGADELEARRVELLTLAFNAARAGGLDDSASFDTLREHALTLAERAQTLEGLRCRPLLPGARGVERLPPG